MFNRPLVSNYLSIVPLSFSDIIIGTMVNNAHLVDHAFLPLWLIIKEHVVG